MPYLRNCWYLAAWSDEVGDELLERRLLGDSVLIYRLADSSVAALSNRCPHRFAPLHLGRRIGDTVQCPYHGLQFGSDGRCIANPQGNRATPSAARLHRYPVIERFGAIWYWPGDSSLADTSAIPDLSFLTDDRSINVHGYLHTEANYQLLSDNILDLGHADFLHPTSLGSGAASRAKIAVRQDGDSVFCGRWMPNDVQGPLMNALFGREGPVDAWMDVIWHPPSIMTLVFGLTSVGASRDEGNETLNLHVMTPETEESTHYFWASTRNFRTDDDILTAQLRAGVADAFANEDGPMIEAQQRMMGTTDLWSLDPVLLSSDAGPVMARRTLARLIEKEASAQSAKE